MAEPKISKRSELVAALTVPAELKSYVARAEALRKGGKTVVITENPEAFGVIWEAGTYLDPSNPEVRKLAADVWKKATRRTISLALGFHRPSAYDRARKAYKPESTPTPQAKAS